ncbi:hypothetical protein PGT21_016949 [Puccinia graminis f. sp. tritici]|uniref:Uncharacterized protein n=1 Tax=Puccinia graminis f. sp. tritici TaxID=56615 RepID=A0A5B0NU40_PUCGR|nr:hypothetical protein PGT21_016949 [Puccinia graminis f. sp. tritici]KAA1092034.1 hypothetical protein PGTUg99_002166 [Puccinia graminis f. sp. tritici]
MLGHRTGYLDAREPPLGSNLPRRATLTLARTTGLQSPRTLRQPTVPIVKMWKPPSMLDLEIPTSRNPIQRYLTTWTTT